jgi:hypothetical protein
MDQGCTDLGWKVAADADGIMVKQWRLFLFDAVS